MNRSIRRLSGVVCAFFVALLVMLAWSVPAHAQTFRGTILGTVTDSAGLSVAGATVTVKNTGTGLTRTVSTSDDGTYSVPELPIGVYTVNVEKTVGPLTHSTPILPRGNSFSLSTSTALTSTQGSGGPTVPGRTAPGRFTATTGEHSVTP